MAAMTSHEAFLAISIGIDREHLTWADLQQPLHTGIVAQEPMPELDAASQWVGGQKLSPHISERPMTVLDNAISENDHENIPTSLLAGKGKELQQAVYTALEWGNFTPDAAEDLRSWAASFV